MIISVIIPCYNEEDYIDNCIESILLQDNEEHELEILFIDGMSNDNTRNIIINYCKSNSYIKILDNEEKIVSKALNIGIEKSKGEIIVRMDAHCNYPRNYIQSLVKYLIVLKADNVGGVLNTLPANNSAICTAIAIGSSHKFGIGNALFRIGVKEIVETDTVPFGCFKRELFDKIGFFDNDLIRNQDDEFNSRIVKNGGKVYLIPDILINYYSRDSITKMAEMFYQYGLFKPLVNKKIGFPITTRQFIPLMFVLGLVFGAGISIFSKSVLIIYLSLLLLYLLISIFYAIKEAVKNNKIGLIILLPYVFFIIHFCYGWGYIMGIYNFLILRKKHLFVNINR